ncbi:AraC family transcriptional regulator [Streptantibioticus parmotrematis]|uniref:AraC family transcriptional regulator n=1 Tax=Streptantibioticus parmotrematis TaxID=2873249 RepID=UPI0033E329FA
MELLVRTTSLNGYVDLVRSFGADPLPLVRSVGLDPAVLADPDQWLPVTAVAELLERSAESTRSPAFGLRLAEVGRLSNLGPLALVAREEPDVRSALELLIQHLHLYNEALRAHISEANGLATVTVDLELDTAPGGRRQVMELLVGVCHRIIRRLIAPDWSPVSVSLTHGAPADPATHHRVLGTAIAYHQDFAGIVLYAADLNASNTLADPLLRTYARQFLQSLPAHRGSPLPQHARGIIEALLPAGRCTVEQVARALDVDVRTLQRHLARTGDTYSSLLGAVRADLAQRYTTRLDRPLTEVAELLGFASLGTFSRWFRTRFGSSPTAWRAAEATDPHPEL